ncbi:MAG: MarR family winged helix-turn-helix transcriptional regulator [Parvibaculaceae bacterium]|uniref:MarR family winged helix-turn-helix transcriptional regulator n=1 Tax=Thalassospira sp. TaxID=1912094 RepID=UPI0032FCE7B4
MNENCICIDVRTAAHKLTQTYDQVLAPSGLTVTQFSQMNLIRSLDAPTLTDLAAASDLERSTLGRNLKVLEKMGMVTMKVGRDARSKTIHLSRKGMNAFKKAAPLWYSAQTELAERLGLAGRAQLEDLLSALTEPLVLNQN